MDNATEDCHKMFQSLVPKIGSSENSEFDLFTVKTFHECEYYSSRECQCHSFRDCECHSLGECE